jgi:hypothetical protein
VERAFRTSPSSSCSVTFRRQRARTALASLSGPSWHDSIPPTSSARELSTIDSAPMTDRPSPPSHGRRSPASFSWRAIGLVFASIALATGFDAVLGSPAAHAAAEPPGAAWSHYVKTTKSRALYRLGCAQGRRMRRDASVRDAIVILDFGRPVSRRFHRGPRLYGASLFRKHGFASARSIRRASEAYGRGVWSCTRGLEQFKIRIGVGTSNWGTGVTRSHGQSWAELVNKANVWSQARHFGTKIEFAGADDIELSWNSPKATKSWVQGYESAAKHPYYDYGSAEECPPIRRCAGAWTLEDV